MFSPSENMCSHLKHEPYRKDKSIKNNCKRNSVLLIQFLYKEVFPTL